MQDVRTNQNHLRIRSLEVLRTESEESHSNRKQLPPDPTDMVLHIIGSRWTIALIRELVSSAKRPSELSRTLTGISAKTLTQRLREFENFGIVHRSVFYEIPPRVEYALTSRGHDLIFVLEALHALGSSWQKDLGIEIPSAVREACSRCFENLADVANNPISLSDEAHEEEAIAVSKS